MGIYCRICNKIHRHFNAIRQAAKLGRCVLGLDADDEIIAIKGKPIYTYDERRIMIEGLRFIERIEDNVPYEMNSKYLNYLFNEKHIDYVLHGDDPCYDANGNDVYAEIKKINKMKIIKRTEGISTTDIIGRILSATDPNYKYYLNLYIIRPPEKYSARNQIRMLPTLWRYIEFSGGKRKPNVI